MMAMRHQRPELGREALDALTPTQAIIVRLIEQGSTNKAIADELGISIKTVQTHRAKINDKLGVHSSLELMVFLRRVGGAPGPGESLKGLLTYFRQRCLGDEAPARAECWLSIIWDAQIYAEVSAEAARLQRSYSWVVQQAWRRARDIIRAMEA
jgi:uncharacterized small protein (TIGR04563 family)